MTRFSSQALFAITLTLVAAGLLALSVAGYLQPAQSLILRPITGVQAWIAVRFSAIQDLLTAPRDIAALQSRITELEAENGRLQQEIVGLRENAAEIEVLRALIKFAQSRPENSYLGAAVIGRDSSPFLQSVWIGAGSDDGISVGMPVVTERGLVGRIADVFATASRIQLISDPESAVNVFVQNNTRPDGVLEAQLSGELWVNLIPQEAEVGVGELVLTSGLGGSYPADVPVGQVINVRKRDFELFQQAVIQPSVDSRQLEFVLVITNFRPLPFQQPAP